MVTGVVVLCFLLAVAGTYAAPCDSTPCVNGACTNLSPGPPLAIPSFAVGATIDDNPSGASAITGNIGTYPSSGTITGFPPGTVTGTIGDGTASAPYSTFDTILTWCQAQTPTTQSSGGTGTYTPGVYHSSSAFAIGSGSVINALGDSSAIFIFQAATSISLASATLSNGAQAKNIYFCAGTSITATSPSAVTYGNLLANSGNVDMGDSLGTTHTGSVFTRDGGITFYNTQLTTVTGTAGNSGVTSSYGCTCVAGYSGVRCQTDIDECSSGPCANGGSCYTNQATNGYTCTCAPGYSGPRCQTDVNECASSPCKNAGSCYTNNAANGFICKCAPGFSGLLCQTDVDECASSPCQHGGTCRTNQATNAYVCTCAPGYSGVLCQTDVEECVSSPCANGGSCFGSTSGQAVNSFICACPPGFSGLLCQTNADECASSPCQNGGSCYQTASNGFACTCAPGYSGLICQTDVNECASLPCTNGGTCTTNQATNGYICTCTLGYSGIRCQTDVDECASAPCRNGGSCYVPNLAGYQCLCAPGFSGLYCQTDVDECLSRPCRNGGSCNSPNDGSHELQASLFVTSPPWQPRDANVIVVGPPSEIGDGFYEPTQPLTGDPDADAAKPSSFSPGFFVFGGGRAGGPNLGWGKGWYSTDLVGGYELQTGEGNTLRRRTGCTFQLNNGVIVVASRNLDADRAYDTGYSANNGVTMSNNDGPSFDEPACAQRDNMTYVIGGLDGQFAVKFDPTNFNYRFSIFQNTSLFTAENRGMCAVVFNGRIIVTGGTNATAAVYSSGAYYSDVDGAWFPASFGFPGGVGRAYHACAVYRGVHYMFGGRTSATTLTSDAFYQASPNSAILAMAFTLPGPPRHPHAVVYNNTLFVFGGFNNTNITDALPTISTEVYALTAVTGSGLGFLCSCVPGYSGSACQTDINECASAPCQNGGSCFTGQAANGYVCTCAPGFSGTVCQTDANDCASSPCRNGGSCYDATNGFVCECPPAYSGNKCQTDIDECSSAPCANGGSCFTNQATNGYICTCAPGASGLRCQTNTNECASSPCMNGATCVDVLGGYSCSCALGYAGGLCQNVSVACNSMPCRNGGTCVDRITNYICDCPHGYSGLLCQTNINECASSPCANGGVCTDSLSGYSCNCTTAPGYNGTDCTRACPAGEYGVSALCLACTIGRFTASSASTTCSDCDAGRYQPSTSSSACIPCDAGSYMDTGAATICLPCDPGKFQDSTLGSSCIDCLANTFANITGLSTCFSCDDGTVASAGATACVPASSSSSSTASAEESSSSSSSSSTAVAAVAAVSNSTTFWTPGAIAGVAVGGAVALALVFYAITYSSVGATVGVLGGAGGAAAGTSSASTSSVSMASVGGINSRSFSSKKKNKKRWANPRQLTSIVTSDGYSRARVTSDEEP